LLIVLASLDSILNIAKSVVGIGGIIFVHELGHFLVGRWCGVKAEAFSIGFGPVLAKWQPGETEYRLSAIPLGGYVKFCGENPDERGVVDPRSFHAATYPRKVAIMLAGVTMNVIAAFVLFAVTFSSGWMAQAPVVGRTAPGMPAWENGLRPGDEFVEINGHRIVSFSDISQETAFSNEISVVLKRDGAVLPPLTLATRDSGEGLRQIGVAPPMVADGRFAVVGDDEQAAGFRSDDRVVAVDGKPVASFGEAMEAHRNAKRDTVWTLERDGARVEATLAWKTVQVPQIGVLLGWRKLCVQQGGAAWAAGLRTGDQPERVGAAVTPTSFAFSTAIADAANAGPVVVRRDGAEVSVALPAAGARGPFLESVAGFGETGEVWATLGAGDVPARTAGLPEFCHIREADGDAVHGILDLKEAVRAAHASKKPVVLQWDDVTGRTGTTTVTPVEVADADAAGDAIGLAPYIRTTLVREPNLFAAMSLGLDRTHRWISRIFDTLGSIATGRLSGSKLSGPIEIARGSYATAKSSWGDFLLFLGMISMNLAVINVLPVPLLDGGQLAVHTIEKIRGRPLPDRVLAGVQWAGLAMLLLLMGYVIRNDIVNLMRS
jgi:regulator of sigma E protease